MRAVVVENGVKGEVPALAGEPFGTPEFSAELWFVEVLAAHPETERVVIRLDGLGRIDVTGALALRTLIDDAHAAGLEITVEGTPSHAYRLLRRVLGLAE